MTRLRPSGAVRVSILCGITLSIGCAHHTASDPAPMPPMPAASCPATAAGPELRPLRRMPPRCPRDAVDRGIQGWVCVRYTVTPTGAVEDVEVLSAAPTGVFEEAVVDAVRQWVFHPPSEDGRPVAVPGAIFVARFQFAPTQGGG